MFDTVVKSVNGILWGEGQVLIYILLFAGIWFSVRLKAILSLNRILHYVLLGDDQVDIVVSVLEVRIYSSILTNSRLSNYA